MELWKVNNIFKIFLLSFVVVFLVLILLLHNVVIARYLLVILFAGVAVYLVSLLFPLLKTLGHPKTPRGEEEKSLSKTNLLGTFVIVLLFAASFIAIRNITASTPGYQTVGFQYLLLPNGTALTLNPLRPNNECAWLESMNIATRQKAMQQDCQTAITPGHTST